MNRARHTTQSEEIARFNIEPSISADGRNYHDLKAGRQDYYQGPGDYNYWRPVLYHAEYSGGDGKFLKIELTGETQIGRVEIIHELNNN